MKYFRSAVSKTNHVLDQGAYEVTVSQVDATVLDVAWHDDEGIEVTDETKLARLNDYYEKLHSL